MSEPKYDVMTIPMLAEWCRVEAEAENDHDVASGLAVDGFMLDALEALREEFIRAAARKAFFG